MKQNRPIGLILAGGQSKRLFPFEIAKPLLEVSGKSLLEQALQRLVGFECYIVCNSKIALEIKTYFKKKKKSSPNFIIEPEGRDTAAAVGFALREIKKLSPSWVAVVSADHWFPKPGYKDFLKTVAAEIKQHPTSLFVGGSESATKDRASFRQFGWIVPTSTQGNSHPVKAFVEKPSQERLDDLLSNRGLINAGMFFGTYETFVRAYQAHYPEVLNAKVKFKTLERQPIDRAIFEKFANVRVVPLNVIWEDLGTWSDWAKHVSVSQGGRQRVVGSENVFSWTQNGTEIFFFDVKDLVVIQSERKILIMPLSKSKDMKLFLEALKL